MVFFCTLPIKSYNVFGMFLTFNFYFHLWVKEAHTLHPLIQRFLKSDIGRPGTLLGGSLR